MRDDILCYDPSYDAPESPICDECGEFMETQIDGEHDPDTGHVVLSNSSNPCTNADCPSNQPNL